jgi:hypothetical protein
LIHLPNPLAAGTFTPWHDSQKWYCQNIYPHHGTQRGVRAIEIFQDDDDRSDPLVSPYELLKPIDNWLLLMAKESTDLDILRGKTRTGRLCGSDAFVEKAELMTDRVLRPRKPEPKPTLKESFSM